MNRATSAAAPCASLSSSAEALLRAVAAEVGLARALDVLEGERAKVRSLMKA